MNFRLTSKSPQGMKGNPLMHHLQTHLQHLKSFGKASPVKNLEQLYRYIRILAEKWQRTNPQEGSKSPFVAMLRDTPCCGKEITIQQGDYKLTIKPEPHETAIT